MLESVPDPRKKRGVRHRFSAILFVSVCAVVSGARSFAEWAADAVEDSLRGMGIGVPNASTIRRALSTFTGDGFDTAIGAWLSGRVRAAWAGRRADGDDAARSRSTARRCGVPATVSSGPNGDDVLGPRQRGHVRPG
ncbi:MAG TPA: transposase family protein [Amycolatopsis sp.]|uniref:transposase family protein n=1 Tax=Amycolatopsis sp. TaxID=37632 RepID=UPI002B47C876|nr:transposase family protein [Amycolatopsis sp.]HKS46613.1 transposase family protein [Amycolatopsis sp.]